MVCARCSPSPLVGEGRGEGAPFDRSSKHRPLSPSLSHKGPTRGEGENRGVQSHVTTVSLPRRCAVFSSPLVGEGRGEGAPFDDSSKHRPLSLPSPTRGEGENGQLAI